MNSQIKRVSHYVGIIKNQSCQPWSWDTDLTDEVE